MKVHAVWDKKTRIIKAANCPSCGNKMVPHPDGLVCYNCHKLIKRGKVDARSRPRRINRDGVWRI